METRRCWSTHRIRRPGQRVYEGACRGEIRAKEWASAVEKSRRTGSAIRHGRSVLRPGQCAARIYWGARACSTQGSWSQAATTASWRSKDRRVRQAQGRGNGTCSVPHHRAFFYAADDLAQSQRRHGGKRVELVLCLSSSVRTGDPTVARSTASGRQRLVRAPRARDCTCSKRRSFDSQRAFVRSTRP